MLRLFFIAAAAMFAVPAPATPGIFYSGNKLLEVCRAESASMLCLGYVLGAIDTVISRQMIEGAPQYICLPGSVTAGQMLEVVKRYMEQTPEQLHYPAVMIVNNAKVKHFPCNRASN